MDMIKSALFLFVLALTLAACGGSSDDAEPIGVPPGPPVDAPLEPPPPPDEPPTPPDGPPADGLEPPSAGSPLPSPDDVVLSIVSSGGFVPVEIALGQLPTMAVYADGTIVRPGPVPEIYPGPLVKPLEVGRLAPETLEWLLEAARTSGVIGSDVDFGYPTVTDLDSTTVTVVIDGVEQSASAYALYEEFAADPTLTPEQTEARQGLMAFVSDAFAAAGTVADWTVPRPDRILVWAFPHVDRTDIDAGPALEWPLAPELIALDPDTGRACIELSGRRAVRLLEAAMPATDLTPWQAGEVQYNLVVRPVIVPADTC